MVLNTSESKRALKNGRRIFVQLVGESALAMIKLLPSAKSSVDWTGAVFLLKSNVLPTVSYAPNTVLLPLMFHGHTREAGSQKTLTSLLLGLRPIFHEVLFLTTCVSIGQPSADASPEP